MTYVFFNDVLAELGHRLNYEAVVNYAGNSFCEKSWDMITENNPFNIEEKKNGTSKKAMSSLASFFSSADIKIQKKDKGENNEHD